MTPPANGGMSQEFHLELNPGNAHIRLRTTELALAKEYTKRLFPASYIKEGPTLGTWYIHLAEGETDNNNAVGMIVRTEAPTKWVVSRRIEGIQDAQNADTRKAA